MDPMTVLDGTFKMVAIAHNKMLHIWITQIIFKWRWWLGVVLSILPWIVWIKTRDKKDTVRLLFIGLVVMLTTGTLDIIGIFYNVWHYDWQVIPLANGFIPFEFSLFPVGVMLILQTNPNINAYIKAVAFAFFSAFIFPQPLIWISMYDQQSWNAWYSFIIYIPLYLFYNYIYKSNLFGIHNNTIH